MNQPQNQSQRRRAENEVVFKHFNQQTQRRLERILPDENKDSFIVKFTCECSNEDCRDSVGLTLEQFKQVHQYSQQFILKPGHDQADLERVVHMGKGFVVAEKYFEPPPTDGKLNATTTPEAA